jgi:hypothetical protein
LTGIIDLISGSINVTIMLVPAVISNPVEIMGYISATFSDSRIPVRIARKMRNIKYGLYLLRKNHTNRNELNRAISSRHITDE